MEIIVLDQVIRQTKKRKMDPSVVSKVYREIELLEKLQSLGFSSLSEYLKNQNGKKMQGSEYIYKYRLTDGDRILYTYGKYLDYVREKNADSLVIVAYAKHDDQGDIPLPSRQQYHFGKEIISTFSDIGITTQDLADMSMDDIEAFQEILSAEFTRLHSLYVFNGQDFQSDPNAYDVYLSDEQNQYIDDYMNDQKPLLIIGGAGTGKTVMATHILAEYKMKNEESDCAYFTQSRELLQKIEKQYRYLSRKNRNHIGLEGSDEDTSFFNINDYCRSKLGLREKNFIRTDQFLEFAERDREVSFKLNKAGIEPLDLWAEIRGTIKGGLDANWRRCQPLNRQNFPREIIDELNKAELLVWQENKQLFVLSDPSRDVVVHRSGEASSKRGSVPSDLSGEVKKADRKLPPELSPEAKKAYRELQRYFSSIDPQLSMMSREEYFSLSPELSTLNPENRKLAYELCLKYQRWLDGERYDENDLVMMLLRQPDLLESFDFLVVDEIQDYTELQIYLLHLLVKDDRLLVMSGDAHQNINPTIFSERRLHALVNGELLTQQLQKNFRCQKKVIEYANGLAELRNTYVAKDKGDRFEYAERDGELPIMLRHTAENERALIEALIEYPDTAILVPTIRDRDRLRAIAKELSEDAPDIVFTVAEIKGMEYRYVVCYNLIGCFHSVWHQILEEKVARKETRYRYYFNLFYVGITRCQDFLCVIEPHEHALFYNLLEEKSGVTLQTVEVFDVDELLIDNLTNSEEDWLKQGEKYEAAGKYEQALQRYRKANADERVIKSCEIKAYAEKRDYESALTIAMSIDDTESAMRMLPELEPDSSLYRLVNVWLHPEEFTRSNGYSADTLPKLIGDSFGVEEQSKIETILIDWIDNNMEQAIGNISSFGEQI